MAAARGLAAALFFFALAAAAWAGEARGPDDRIGGLIEAIGSTDAAISKRAAAELMNCGRSAIPRIEAACREGSGASPDVQAVLDDISATIKSVTEKLSALRTQAPAGEPGALQKFHLRYPGRRTFKLLEETDKAFSVELDGLRAGAHPGPARITLADPSGQERTLGENLSLPTGRLKYEIPKDGMAGIYTLRILSDEAGSWDVGTSLGKILLDTAGGAGFAGRTSGSLWFRVPAGCVEFSVEIWSLDGGPYGAWLVDSSGEARDAAIWESESASPFVPGLPSRFLSWKAPAQAPGSGPWRIVFVNSDDVAIALRGIPPYAAMEERTLFEMPSDAK